VEEFAKYPVCREDDPYDRREVIEHLGILAAEYTGIDLSDTKSMWSIMDLAPLDHEIDEKQENTDLLVSALRETNHACLAHRVDEFNAKLRQGIKTVFADLPRCVYQGDLNSTNTLQHDGHFAGLIDFNLSGTEVNINLFLNESNEFPDDDIFDSLSPQEIIAHMHREQQQNLSVIFRHYSMNEMERFAFVYYEAITNLFQYPNVCQMVTWLKDENRTEKCAKLIEAIMNYSENNIEEAKHEYQNR